MKNSLLTVLVMAIFFTTGTLAAQPRSGPGNVHGTVDGVVMDSTSRQPMEYVNVILYAANDSSQVTGTITNKHGRYRIQDVNPGQYFLAANFIGYAKTFVNDIQLTSRNREVQLDTLFMAQASVQSKQSVVVEGEKPPISYEIDRKVIDVSSQETAASGNAADVLENVPSVTVDIEGNVSLRGSGSFTVLIDGRPTVLDAQDALQQIPASTIDDIEIITNPSAKYDPEGTAGIINIVTKKNALQGISGLVNANGGMNDKYGGETILEYRTDKYTATLSGDFNRRIYDGSQISRRHTTYNGTTSFTNANGTSSRGRLSSGVRAGLDYNVTPNDMISLQGRVGRWGFQGGQHQVYREWTSAAPDPNVYTSTTDMSFRSLYYALNADYQKKFHREGHKLQSDLEYRYRNGNQKTTDELRPTVDQISDGRKTIESGPEGGLQFDLQYTLPFSKSNKFEAGLRSRFRSASDYTDYSTYSTTQDQYINQPKFSHEISHDQRRASVYSLYSGKLNKFGYQLGLRGEYTYRNIVLLNNGQTFSLDRWDYFPTLHTSYDLPGIPQIMASYSRRIDRPRSWYLEPFKTWTDAYNVRSGNPGLVPEYIDSYELGYQTNLFGFISSTAEMYYRVSHNKIERVESVYQENVTLHRPENVGTDYSFGTDLMFRFDVADFWNLSLMGSIYHYSIQGVLQNEAFSRQSNNWNARIRNSLNLWKNNRIQIQGRYRSPTVSAQGRRQGVFMTDMSVRHDFMEKKFSAILQIRDLFGTGNRESVSEGPNFYRYSYRDRESPIVMLTLRLNINNFKDQQNNRNGQGQGGGEYDGGSQQF